MKIFFSGIGGSGVSAIACFMADRGHTVVGSDRAFDENPRHPVSGLLSSRGITLVPQDGAALDESFDFAVFSTAVEPDRPEILKARSLGIPVKTRPEYLAEIVKEFRTIAVAGTSGKSTTAGMLAFLMRRLGMSPNFIGGGRVKQFIRTANPGNALTGNSDWLVIEACESDGTIVNYKPFHSIILNLELDHHSVDETGLMFRTMIRNTAGQVFLNSDDPHLVEMLMPGLITFSLDKPSDYRAVDIAYRPFGSDFSVRGTRFRLPLPGRYNLYDALPCIALLSEMGVQLEEIAQVALEFDGLERRFDILLDDGKKLVIDDYAHNPHKISSLMEAVNAIRDRVCYIFQPHGFGPTRLMRNGYIEAFTGHLRDPDHLIILPIFYAGGTASRDISSQDIADGIRAGGKSVETVGRRETVLERIREWDTYIVFGARDETLSDFAKEVAKELTMTDARE